MFGERLNENKRHIEEENSSCSTVLKALYNSRILAMQWPARLLRGTKHLIGRQLHG